MDIIEELKALPFTLEVEQDKDGVFVQVKEFPTEYEEEATFDETLKATAKGLKGWSEILAGDFERWSKYHKSEVLYLLKILVSSEEELLECLRSSKCVNI